MTRSLLSTHKQHGELLAMLFVDKSTPYYLVCTALHWEDFNAIADLKSDEYIAFEVEKGYDSKEVACGIAVETEIAERLVQKRNELKADFFELPTLDAPISHAFFDMDSTLIDMEVMVALADRYGKGAEISAITERAMRGELDFSQSFTKRLASLEGLDAQAIQEVIEAMPINEGVERLASILNEYSISSHILSGGFVPFAEVLREKLRFNAILSNELDITDSGRLSGKVCLPIIDAEAKAAYVLKQMNNQANHIVVGDGANDLPMMQTTAWSFAYKAKPIVEQKAHFSIKYTGIDAIAYWLELVHLPFRAYNS